MTYLDEIVCGATDSESISTSDLLRKVYVVARRVKADLIAAWVKNELKGYSCETDLPLYRRDLLTRVVGEWGDFGQEVHQFTMPPPLEEKNRHLFTVNLQESIAELEGLASANEPVTQYWSSESMSRINELVKEGRVSNVKGLKLYRAYKDISVEMLKGVIDSVRTKALELALDLQDINPYAGESATMSSTVENDEGIANVVNNFEITVFGDGANVSYGDNAI